jgi:fermentation-respiration switch protein FrsA (DUF1100 family)
VIGRSAFVVLVVVALVLSLTWVFQRKLIYFPDRTAVPPAATVISGARDITLVTADGLRLGAWLVPASTRSGTRGAAGTVLIAPGNGGNRLGRASLAVRLAGEGLTVLLPDYRGYGGNPGTPTKEGLARDIRAALTYLTDVEGVPASRIVYFGESLGAAVVTELAVAHPPAGLLLRSPFQDLAAAGAHHYPYLPVRLLLRDRFTVAARIGQVHVPTVVVYGTADSVVPAAQSRTVARRAAGPVRELVIPGADHNDAVLVQGPEVIAAVRGLLP